MKQTKADLATALAAEQARGRTFVAALLQRAASHLENSDRDGSDAIINAIAFARKEVGE